jgi:hypothetical protein
MTLFTLQVLPHPHSAISAMLFPDTDTVEVPFKTKNKATSPLVLCIEQLFALIFLHPNLKDSLLYDF